MYRQSLNAVNGVGGDFGGGEDVDGGIDGGIEVRELNDGERLEGGRGAGEERVVAQAPEHLEEDLKEEGEPAPEPPPYFDCPS